MSKEIINTEQPIENNVIETVTEEVKVNTVIQEFELFTPAVDTDNIIMALPSDNYDAQMKKLESFPNLEIAKTEAGSKWEDTLEKSVNVTYRDSWLNSVTTRVNALWGQNVVTPNGPIGLSKAKFDVGVNGKLTGEAAVLHVMASLKMGGTHSIPLWHSGFFITFKPPSDSALLDLYTRIIEDKIRLGRQTYGFIFSNVSAILSNTLLEFAIAHIYSTSLSPELQANIKQYIKQADIPILLAGLATTIYPNGFPYIRAMVGSSPNDIRTVKEIINLAKTFWYDRLSFSKWQLAHMSNPHATGMTKEKLDKYQDEFVLSKGRTVKLNDVISIALKIPSASEYIESSQKWISSIIDLIHNSFGSDLDIGIKNMHIINQGKATTMRQYAHYVKAIYVQGSEIDDINTIDDTLNVLSANSEITKKFFEEIKLFICDTTNAVVATVVTEKKENVDENSILPRFPDLIILDPMAIFFTLLVQRAVNIQSRN